MKRGSLAQHPSQLRKERRKFFFLKIAFSFFIVLVLAVLSVWGLNYSLIDPNSTKVLGNVIVSAQDISDSVDRLIGGKYFGLIPKSNILFYPKEEILLALRSAFPILDTIEVKRGSFSALTILVVERKPYGVYCEGDLDAPQNSCIFLDNNGFLYKETPTMTGSNFVIFESASTSLDVNNIIFPSFFDSLKLFIAKLSDLKLEVRQVFENENKDLEILVKGDTKLFLAPPFDFDMAFENLKTVLSGSILRENIKISDVEYVDLRFGNRVYYKLKALQ